MLQNDCKFSYTLLAMLVVSKGEFNHFDTTTVYMRLLRSVVMQ